MTPSTLTHFKLHLLVTWAPLPSFLSPFLVSLSLFLHFFALLLDSPIMCQGINKVYPELHQQIPWHSSINLVTQFWWCVGQTHHTPVSADANAKSPCQLDMTHATLHTHHCDNPVIINTNLSVSAWGAKVLWSRRKGDEGGQRKGRHTKYRSWSALSGSGIWR